VGWNLLIPELTPEPDSTGGENQKTKTHNLSINTRVETIDYN
jgi:hypothetical protein